jgi:hypothetical protein
VIPSTILGLVVFAAAVGPGYTYVKTAERWRPASERTPLREAAEIVVTGSLATAVGVVVALLALDAIRGSELAAIAQDPARHLITHPAELAGGLVVVVVVSYGGSFGVAKLLHRGRLRVFSDSAWYGAFERDLPESHGIYATVGLRDGRAITGGVRSFTAEPGPVDDRELCLHAPSNQPMSVRTADGWEGPLREQFVLLKGSDIQYIAGSYLPLVEDPTKRPARGSGRATTPDQPTLNTS